MSTINYRVPKTEVMVDILVDHRNGMEAGYILFLGMVSRYRKGPETIFEFLNKDKVFIPLKDVDGGRVTILNVNEIMYVREREESEPPPLLKEITVSMTHNVTLKVVHFKPMPDAHSRTLDYLNDQSRFIVFYHEGRKIYINKAKIVKVEEG